jgi:hypothetical protein
MGEKDGRWYRDGYRLFIVLGLTTVVLITVGSAIYTQRIGDFDSRLPIFAGGGAVTAFLVVLLALWWYQILAGGRAEIRELRELASDQPPPLAALKSWNTLYQQMVYSGGTPEVLEKESARGQRKVVEWFAWANLLALFPLANVWLYLLGRLSQERFMSFVPPVLIALIFLMLLRTYMLLGNRGDHEAQIAAGLGLEASSMEGTKRYTGARNGHAIQIESQGRRSKTRLAAPTPDFEVQSVEGKLKGVGKLPASVAAAIDLPKAKRWRGVQVNGGRDEIRIQRESRGQSMWLYDLWLAERIAAATQ